MLLHIDVKNKVATYQKRDGCIVCGNSGYKIEFNFDTEWEGVSKEAILIVNGAPTRVPITENMCDVPIIRSAEKIVVGVHSESAGMTTTGTEIPCKKSILCS